MKTFGPVRQVSLHARELYGFQNNLVKKTAWA